MAAISKLKFNIAGLDYTVNVNCNSSGQFSANLPKEVAEALRINEKLVSDNLGTLTKTFEDKLKEYKNAETKEELFILVAYHARGEYTYKKDGSILFSHMDEKHNINISFSEISNALGLDFTVAIKQTIDGKEKWFEAQLGSDFAHFQKEFNQPDIYHKQATISQHRFKRYKIIPFNQIALNTLTGAQEKLRTLSEMLFNFVSQDEVAMLETLTNTKLLQ
jgi:hypothetical protein